MAPGSCQAQTRAFMEEFRPSTFTKMYNKGKLRSSASPFPDDYTHCNRRLKNFSHRPSLTGGFFSVRSTQPYVFRALLEILYVKAGCYYNNVSLSADFGEVWGTLLKSIPGVCSFALARVQKAIRRRAGRKKVGLAACYPRRGQVHAALWVERRTDSRRACRRGGSSLARRGMNTARPSRRRTPVC